MVIKRFEDIDVWKLSRKLVKKIYSFTENDRFKKDYGLKDQIRRSAVSIMSNIAEGFEKQSSIEFIRYLFIAKASSGETRSHIYIAFDLEYINKEEFEDIIIELENISKSLSGFIKYLRATNKK